MTLYSVSLEMSGGSCSLLPGGRPLALERLGFPAGNNRNDFHFHDVTLGKDLETPFNYLGTLGFHFDKLRTIEPHGNLGFFSGDLDFAGGAVGCAGKIGNLVTVVKLSDSDRVLSRRKGPSGTGCALRFP